MPLNVFIIFLFIWKAVERGIYFEIPYAPAIRDATLRKNVLTNAMTLVSLCRGKNIIITSQAVRVSVSNTILKALDTIGNYSK